jgi:two-component system sensor histidine kinase UhpB
MGVRYPLKMGLEARLNGSIALIIVLILGLTFAWAIRDARLSIRQEASASVNLALGLIDAALSSGEIRPATLHQWLDRIAHIDRIRHLRIESVTNLESPVQRQSSGLSLHQGVPDWFYWAVATEPLAVVRAVNVVDESPTYIRIHSNAEDEIREAWDETKGFMGLILLMALAIYASVHMVVGRALRPVNQIMDGLNAIEGGDYDRELEISGLPEIDRISQGINHLSSTLRASRQENRALTRHARGLVEEERRYLARELHDELGQSLSLIKFAATGLKRKEAFQREDALHQITQTCDRLFQVVRDMVRKLRPSVLDELGLTASLEDLVANWRITSPEVSITLHCDDGIDAETTESGIDLLRITQECLSNVARHANATKIDVRLKRLGQSPSSGVVLSIQDDGSGFDSEAQPMGFGLKGIRERVEGLSGVYRIESQPGSGTWVWVHLPSAEQ